jgi:hypothetical protein
MEAHSELAEAIRKIAEGRQAALELSDRNREIYQRAKDVLAPLNIELDVAASECADVARVADESGNSPAIIRSITRRIAAEKPGRPQPIKWLNYDNRWQLAFARRKVPRFKRRCCRP